MDKMPNQTPKDERFLSSEEHSDLLKELAELEVRLSAPENIEIPDVVKDIEERMADIQRYLDDHKRASFERNRQNETAREIDIDERSGDIKPII